MQTKRKTVRWAADDQLEKIKLIEVISYGDEHNVSLGDPRAATFGTGESQADFMIAFVIITQHSLVMQGTGGLDNAEGHMFKVHNLEMLEVLDWYAPKGKLLYSSNAGFESPFLTLGHFHANEQPLRYRPIKIQKLGVVALKRRSKTSGNLLGPGWSTLTLPPSQKVHKSPTLCLCLTVPRRKRCS